MTQHLDEASWKVKYEKPHHADWAKTLDGRLRTGGMWKSQKQHDFFARLASVQPGSKKDEVTRFLHRDARRRLPNIKNSSRLLITRYNVSPGNGEWFSKVNIYEFDKDGLIRKWRVSRVNPRDGSEAPVFRWSNAEVLWKRTGYRDTKQDHRVLPRSNVSTKNAISIARYIARRHKINTMSAERLRATVMKGIIDRVNPIVVDYKKAILYKLKKIPRAPQNMAAWEEVIAGDVDKVIAAFPAAASKGFPSYGNKRSPGEDAHIDAQWREYAANNLGHEDPGIAADLASKAGGVNPYESKDSMSADLRILNADVAAIGVQKEGDDRNFWLEMASGGVYHYSSGKGEFGSFRNHLIEEIGEERAIKALQGLRQRSREVARGAKS